MKKEIFLLSLVVILLCICYINQKEHFTDFDNKAIIPMNLYPELNEIINNKEIILSELKNIIDKKVWILYDFFHKEKIIEKDYNKEKINQINQTIDKYYINEFSKPEWLVYPLFYNAEAIDKSKELFPKTIELISKLKFVGAAGISCLEGNGYIPPHTDEGIERYKFHLPLEIPEGCGIKINNIDYNFDEPFIFDDTFIHSVWNKSDKPRFVLIIDIFRK